MNRLLAATLVLSFAVSGCSKHDAADQKTPTGQPFEVLAGGGAEQSAERALDADLSGTVEDLEVAPDGTAYLLASADGKARLERISPDGTRTRIELTRPADAGRQIAVGPDGSVYINLDPGGEKDAIQRIRPDGSRQVVIRYDAAASTREGGQAKAFGVFGGLTVDAQGRLVFAVEVTKAMTAGVLVRRVEADGTARTIAGKLTTFASRTEADAATPAALHPPASGKALDWGTTRAMTVNEIATQTDGTLVLQTTDELSAGDTRTILAVTPTGTMRQLAEGEGPAPAITAAPFTPDGTRTLGRIRSGIAAADGLLTIATAPKPSARPEDGSYDWAGQYSDGQRAVLKDFQGLAIRLIRPDGTITTGAFGDRSALRGGYLYVVVRNFQTDRFLLGRVKIPA